jgi:hypothetical protein
MALLWIEGFEGFGSSTGVAPSPTGIVGRKYPLTNRESFMDVETGRFGYCLEIVETNGYIQTPNLTTDDTLICGCAINLATLPGSISRLFSFYDGSTDGVNIRVKSDGTIAAYLGSSTLLGTSTSQLTATNWYYIELKVVTHNTAGTVDLVVNGSSWLSLTSQDTQPGSNAYHTAVRLGQNDGAVYTRYDDMYVLDSTGSKNNAMLGNHRVDSLDPDGAGDDTNWTPSAGSNYQCVDDGALLDEDTSYNETSTDAHDDLFTYDNLPGDASTVAGVMIVTETRVTTGSMDVSQNIKSGGTEYPGSADTIVSTTYVTITRLEEDDPDTSVAWTVSGVNGAQFGVRANT